MEVPLGDRPQFEQPSLIRCHAQCLDFGCPLVPGVTAYFRPQRVFSGFRFRVFRVYFARPWLELADRFGLRSHG